MLEMKAATIYVDVFFCICLAQQDCDNGPDCISV